MSRTRSGISLNLIGGGRQSSGLKLGPERALEPVAHGVRGAAVAERQTAGQEPERQLVRSVHAQARAVVDQVVKQPARAIRFGLDLAHDVDDPPHHVAKEHRGSPLGIPADGNDDRAATSSVHRRHHRVDDPELPAIGRQPRSAGLHRASLGYERARPGE
jgi:hypothetical protein